MKGSVHLAVYISPCYFVTCSAIILIYNFRRFRGWQRLSISLFVFFQISGTVLQMFVFPDILLALFMSALGLMMMLFTMETPDYQKPYLKVGNYLRLPYSELEIHMISGKNLTGAIEKIHDYKMKGRQE